MFIHWKIDRNSNVNLYNQIAEIIRKDILSKILPAGSKLPSQRKMMEIFGVSRSIIILAIEQLVSEKLVTIKSQSGVFINDVEISSHTNVNWGKYFSNGIYRAGSNERIEQLTFIGKSQRKVINISAAGLGSEYNLLKPIMEKLSGSILNKNLSGLNHFDKYGYLPLREAIVEHVSRHGIKVTPRNVLIMPSVLQSINIICQAFLNLGANFVYAKPNVIATDSTVHFLGCNTTPIPMDKKGIMTDKLIKALQGRSSFLYLNPTSQNPTGKTMELSRRYEVLDITSRYHTPVIEVDSLRDIWIDTPYPPSLKALSKGDNVIYLGSMLRALTFNLRISWIIAEEEVIEKIGNIKIQSDIFPSIILQLIACELLSSGSYSKFLNEIRPLMSKAVKDALCLLDKYFKDIASWDIDDCKYYIWLKFNDRINTRKLFEGVRGVEFYPGFFFDKDDKSHISICPAGLSYNELDESLSLLNKQIRKIFDI